MEILKVTDLKKGSSRKSVMNAKKAADLLSVPLRAESVPGEGSTFILDLRQN